MLPATEDVKRSARLAQRVIICAMLLAADIGGTKTLIGLYERHGDRPKAVVTREYVTLDFDSFESLVDAFLEEAGGGGRIEALCAGVAGPVTGLTARLTSAPWIADAGAIAEKLGGFPAELVNDLEAMASSVLVLEPSEIRVLQEGVEDPVGNAAVLAAGTGLGEALLHNLNGTFVPAASEGGHADFAARTPRELEMVGELSTEFGRVEVERIVSGKGLVNVFRFTHGARHTHGACPEIPANFEGPALAAAVSQCALEGRCARCVEALDIFVGAYGAEAGNLALRYMATAGVYIGGGIAPKILPALQTGSFIAAFLAKEPMRGLLEKVPVKVILNASAGLVGASVRAATLV
jgi:glucokinase